MKQIALLLVLCIFMMSSICTKRDIYHDRISFINKSGKAVYVEGDFSWPDTSMNFVFSIQGNSYKKVLPDVVGNPLELMDTYEERFEQLEVLMVFVFDAEVLETTPWDTVKSNYLVLKRYDLSLEDLQDMDWKIIYP